MLRNYLKIAWKVLGRRKFYTFISLFGISFTLLVLIVAAALLDHIFGPVAPETRVDRTLSTYIIQANASDGRRNGPPGYLFLDRYVRTLSHAEKVSLHTWRGSTRVFLNGTGHDVYLKYADGRFWEVFDFRFLEGGPYSERDERERNFVAVINRATRERFFGNQPAIGRFLEIDGRQYRVAGVVANVPYLRFTTFSDIWVPVSTQKSDAYKTEFWGAFMGTVLAKGPAEAVKVKEEFQSVMRRIEPPEPRFKDMSGGLETFFETLSRMLLSGGRMSSASAGKLMAWLIGIAVAFMLLPTVNLVNINVSRIIERASEIGVRKSFGASSWTLVGQFVIENVVLTAVGAAIGLVLAMAVLRALSASGMIPYAVFTVNYRIFLYALTMTIFFGLLSGVYPAWKMSRLHPVNALRGGVR